MDPAGPVHQDFPFDQRKQHDHRQAQAEKVYDQLENIRLMNEFADNCLPDMVLRNKAKIAISSLAFTMTSYYYRMDREYRPGLSKAIPREVLAEAIAHPQTRFQQAKLFFFAYLRPLLDIYEFFHMR